MMRTGTSVAVLIGILAVLALALGGCGSSNLFSTSPLDMFKSSPKATAGTGGADNKGADTDVDCPDVQVRTGASTLMIGSKPDEQGEPSALDLRYQATIIRTARECHLNAGVMSMKVGIEGRVITGPAGAPGAIDVPLRIVIVQEGVAPKTIVSKFARIPVTISSAIDRVNFTHVQDDIAFPMPPVAADLDAYVVYVGFDALAAQPEKPKPKSAPKKPKAKAKSVAKPKQS